MPARPGNEQELDIASFDGTSIHVRIVKGAKRVDMGDAAHLSAIENPAAFNRALMEFLQ